MNLYTGLLFQSGHIADAKLAIRLAQSPSETVQQSSPSVVVGRAHRRSFSERVRWLVEELVLLGGRPVSNHHLDDIDEPFPPLHRC
jgi:hypothetical protein